MKLSFFKKPVRYIPNVTEGSLQNIRERIIKILLVCAITLGTLAFIIALLPALRAGLYGSIIAFTISYVWILIVTLLRRKFSYEIKIYSLVFLVYILGVINLVQNGLSADAGVFLLSFTVLSSLMIGPRSGVFALVVSLATFTTGGYLMSTGRLIPPVLTNYSESWDWISGGMVLILLGTVLLGSQNTILRGLIKNIDKVKTLALEADHDKELIRQRSEDLQYRLGQLRANAGIEHTISALLDPYELQQKVVSLLAEKFELYYVCMFLLRDDEFFTTIFGSGVSNPTGINPSRSGKANTTLIMSAGSGPYIPVGFSLKIDEKSNYGLAILNRKPQLAEVSSQTTESIARCLPLALSEATLPLISHNKVLGILLVYSTKPNAFDKDDIALFQSSADSLAIALDNALLFKRTQDDLEEIRALQRQYVKNAWAETESHHGVMSYTYNASQDSGQDGAGIIQPTNADVNISPYNVPIKLRDQPIGQLIVETDETGWSNEDRAFIDSIITDAALALENARLLDETQQRANRDRLLADITSKVRASTDIETILSTAVRELGLNLSATETVITLNPVLVEEKVLELTKDNSLQQEANA